ncbi:hypothetical protein [Methylosinus sp. Sm6]|uniref:hypothetical protein n=1 Tax=Methylosinus sp. Sm6 TaxID=2866948 RepID=UPI001C98F56C|nr:hypothetical protein [Methylosinus sp. Sm6]MBY6243832.1 hypothetical protein [Methylosinus sp. Sm6]
MNDLVRRFADVRGKPLPDRLGIGVLSAVIGAAAFHALARLVGYCQAFAAFYAVVQIAGLSGGFVAAASCALASVLIVHFSAEPVTQFWAGAVLLFCSAALAGLAGERLRGARESAASEPRRSEGPQASRAFESIAATITHDIIQPLAAAVAYLQTARRLLSAEAEGSGSSIAATVDKAAAQAARAGRLVARLRDFLLHGPPRLAAVRLHAILLEAAGAAGHREDGPLLRLDARRDLVMADPAQLEQLFGEILRAAPARAPAAGPTIATSSDEKVVTVTVALGELAAAIENNADLSLWRAMVEAQNGAFRTEQAAEGRLAIEFTLPLAAAGE